VLLQAGVAVAVWRAENRVNEAAAADSAAEAGMASVMAVQSALDRAQSRLGSYIVSGTASDRGLVDAALAELDRSVKQMAAGQSAGHDAGGAQLTASVDKVRSALAGVLSATLARRDAAAKLVAAATDPEDAMAALAQAASRAPDRGTVDAVAAIIATSIHPLAFAQRYAQGGDPLDGETARKSAAQLKQDIIALQKATDNPPARLVRMISAVTAALDGAFARAGHLVKIEIEVDTLEQLDEVLAHPRVADAILLDNFTTEALAEAVRRTRGRALLEASGGITLETVAAVAATGVDVISIGALTHSVVALDIGLDIAAAPK